MSLTIEPPPASRHAQTTTAFVNDITSAFGRDGNLLIREIERIKAGLDWCASTDASLDSSRTLRRISESRILPNMVIEFAKQKCFETELVSALSFAQTLFSGEIRSSLVSDPEIEDDTYVTIAVASGEPLDEVAKLEDRWYDFLIEQMPTSCKYLHLQIGVANES